MISIVILLGTLCIFFGILTYSVCRNPRPFRRFYQEIFESTRKHSVSRNKLIDESFQKMGPKYAIPLVFVGTLLLFAAMFLKSHFVPTLEELAEQQEVREQIEQNLETAKKALLNSDPNKATEGEAASPAGE